VNAGERSGSPRPGTCAITSLLAAPDGRIYGIGHGTDSGGHGFREIFVFDPKVRRVVRALPTPEGDLPDGSLQLGRDGAVYSATVDALYRIKPNGEDSEVLARLPGQIEIPGPQLGKTLFFATGHRLRSLTLP
jgi:hypothetical protein